MAVRANTLGSRISITDRASLPHRFAKKIIVRENSARFISSTAVNRAMKSGISRMSGISARYRLVGNEKHGASAKSATSENGGKFAKFVRATPENAARNCPQRRTLMVAVYICAATTVTALSNFPRCNPGAHTGGWRGRVGRVVRFSPACSFACPRLLLQPLAGAAHRRGAHRCQFVDTRPRLHRQWACERWWLPIIIVVGEKAAYSGSGTGLKWFKHPGLRQKEPRHPLRSTKYGREYHFLSFLIINYKLRDL